MKKIKLSQNKFALVDDEDYNKVNKFIWTYTSHGYATATISPKKREYMHRFIFGVKKL